LAVGSPWQEQRLALSLFLYVIPTAFHRQEFRKINLPLQTESIEPKINLYPIPLFPKTGILFRMHNILRFQHQNAKRHEVSAVAEDRHIVTVGWKNH
jgi:hypothetical protein